MKKLIMLFSLLGMMAQAQVYFPTNDDISPRAKITHAFTNATIIINPTTTVKNASLIIKDGKIVALGTSIKLPENAVVHDCSNAYIYPSFIEAYSDFSIKNEITKPKKDRHYNASREGYYWNDHIRSEQQAYSKYEFDKKAADSLVQVGYGIVQSYIPDGIARGTGMISSLQPEASDATRILSTTSGNFYSLSKSKTSNQVYPSSLMGTFALLRQLELDATWYANGNNTTTDISIEAYNRNRNLVSYFEVGDKKNLLRVAQLGQEINKEFVFIGGSDSYELLEAVKNTKSTLIVPIDLPKPFNLSNPYHEYHLSLGQLRDWDQARYNLGMLEAAEIPFAITMKDSKNAKEFFKNLRTSIEYGLSPEAALASLTIIPARILGISKQAGTLEKGKLANFLITSGPIFEKETVLYENWIQGEKSEVTKPVNHMLDGEYNLQQNGISLQIKISDLAKKIKVTDDKKKKRNATIYLDGTRLSMNIAGKDSINPKFITYNALLTVPVDKITGTATSSTGMSYAFSATKKMKEKKELKKTTHQAPALTYPNVSYGSATLPVQETVLYKNASVWTNEDEGILTQTDVLVTDGKISAVGKNLSSRNARVIDATGKHLTSGIIDEHSHIAIDNGVNEAGHNSTAEVRIADVVDHEDINIYRNLAGGVTTAQLLHGSANPIGGQSAIIKMKWGYTAPDLVYQNSPKFIKFALGENVKQTYYQNNIRYPKSRMGVEQVFVDYFTRAQEYDASRNKKDFRKDEELETLVEILNGERFISCHSYVQSEINMLMKVAERFDFKINTFTHILEGYKVADKMAEHGVGGSTFSDWWAYKFEVNDAIPFNAAIMHEQGVTVAINSDDAEMSRHLNQEAAKAVKYGGVSEEDAWKFVTLNPAKLLHIADRTGSIKVGKDADLVLWNAHPLSVSAKPIITMIDGIVFFDIEKDIRFRESIKREREALVQKMVKETLSSKETQEPTQEAKTLYECNSLEW